MLPYPFELKGLDLCKTSSNMNKPIFIASAPLGNLFLSIGWREKTQDGTKDTLTFKFKITIDLK